MLNFVLESQTRSELDIMLNMIFVIIIVGLFIFSLAWYFKSKGKSDVSEMSTIVSWTCLIIFCHRVIVGPTMISNEMIGKKINADLLLNWKNYTVLGIGLIGLIVLYNIFRRRDKDSK